MSADFLARGYSAFLAYLAEPALRSLAIGCVAGVALAAFHVKRVTTRLLVWTAVLCAALAMPPLGAFLPRLALPVPAAPLVRSLQARFDRGPAHAFAQEATASRTVLHAAAVKVPHAGPTVYAASNKTLPGRARYAARATASYAVVRDAEKFSTASASSKVFEYPAVNVPLASTRAAILRGSPAAVPERRIVIPWTALLLGIYLLGAAILFARLLVGVLFSRRLEHAAQNIDEREALRLLRFRSCIAGLAAAPRLKESAMLAVPATVGVRRTVILLPADWRGWPEEQLDAILAHEISHVARRDGLTQLLSLIHRAIFWFSPLGWWLDKQLTDLAEQASDEAALAGGADRTRYAETLLGFFARLTAAPGRVWWQGVSMAKAAKAGSAERRVDRILAWKGAMSMRKSFAIALIAIAAPLVFVAASVHPFIARAQDKPPAPPQNVMQPGGPAAPALPNAPKGGVKGGVSAPAPMAAAPVAPVLPAAPNGGVTALAPMAAPAIAGVTALGNMGTPPPSPVLSPAPMGPITLIPQGPMPASTPRASDTLTPTPGTAAATAPLAGYAPSTPMATITLTAPLAPPALIGGDSIVAEDAEAQLLAADQELQQTNVQSADVAELLNEVRAALERVEAVEKAADAAGAAQILAAQHAIEKARLMVEQNSAGQILEAESAIAEAKRDVKAAEAAQHEAHTVTINGAYTSGGGRYVMMTGNDESVEMSGDDEDFHHARELRKKLGTDLIWFERDEKSYVITDPAFIAKAKALFAPEDALSKQQDELSRQQDALSKQQDALSEQQDNVKVKVPDISPDIKRVQDELDALRQSGATQSELGRLQSELGRLQSRIGGFQSEAGVQQSKLGQQQSELGRQQSELGRRQGELGRQQGEIARKASQQLREMFDDAIAKGIAKPE